MSQPAAPAQVRAAVPVVDLDTAPAGTSGTAPAAASGSGPATPTGPRLRATLAAMPGYVPGAPPRAPQGLEPYKLSSNENPYPPLPGVLQAVAAAAADLNRYPDGAAAALVAALAADLDVPPECLVLGTGSVAVLGSVVSAACEAGDEVVHAWRSFEAYPIVVTVAGGVGVPVPLDAHGRHDVAAMVAAVTDRTRVVLVCTPNNPTGPVVTATELDDLLDAVPDDVLVVVDEAYVEFVRDPAAARGLDAWRARPNVVVLRTFSKAYGLAGLRVGFAVAHPEVARVLRLAAVPFGVSGIAQVAAVASLAAQGELLARVDALVVERERVVAALSDQGWWDLPDAQANFVWLPLGERSAAFAAAAGEQGLSVRPFAGQGVRVSIGEVLANDRFLALAAGWVPGCQDPVPRPGRGLGARLPGPGS